MKILQRRHAGKPIQGTPIDASGVGRGLVGLWACNEGSGPPCEALSGTPASASTLAWTSGLAGRGPVLTGSGSQYFTTTTPAGCRLDVTGTALSWGAWFYSSSTGGYQTILTKQHPTTQGARQYGLFTVNSTASQLFVQLNGPSGFGLGGANCTPSLSVPWVLNSWNLILVTYDGAAVRRYVNGQIAASVAATGSIATVAGSQVYSGYDTAYASNGLDGSVDLPMVWSRVLSDGEVASLHADPWQLFRPRGLPIGGAAPAVGFALSGPGSVSAGSAAPFILTPAAADTDTVTFSDGGGGGTFTPASLSWAGTSGSKGFTYANATPGTYSIAATSAAGGTVSGSPFPLIVLPATAGSAAVARRKRWFPQLRHH